MGASKNKVEDEIDFRFENGKAQRLTADGTFLSKARAVTHIYCTGDMQLSPARKRLRRMHNSHSDNVADLTEIALTIIYSVVRGKETRRKERLACQYLPRRS
jgi:hypothetical protein